MLLGCIGGLSARLTTPTSHLLPNEVCLTARMGTAVSESSSRTTSLPLLPLPSYTTFSKPIHRLLKICQRAAGKSLYHGSSGSSNRLWSSSSQWQPQCSCDEPVVLSWLGASPHPRTTVRPPLSEEHCNEECSVALRFFWRRSFLRRWKTTTSWRHKDDRQWTDGPVFRRQNTPRCCWRRRGDLVNVVEAAVAQA